MVAQGPWGNVFGPLNLTQPLLSLLDGLQKNFPKFYGDGKQHANEHLSTFYIACSILRVEHEDVSVRLFIETLQGGVANWLYHLAPQTNTN